nr:MAG TPA: hypothetical protein [Caudoviricetes sp.]
MCKNIGVILIPLCYYWGCKVVFLACYIVSLYEGAFYHKARKFTNKNEIAFAYLRRREPISSNERRQESFRESVETQKSLHSCRDFTCIKKTTRCRVVGKSLSGEQKPPSVLNYA